ncbi:MAG: hypothetical protein KGL35_03275 [Bradyrhizobium sp.]|nr:hypothetical protein [Bradyrhizobium sp.]
MSFDFRIDGTNRLIARLGALSSAMSQAVATTITYETQAVKNAASVRMAELFKNPGRMQDSLSTDVVIDGPTTVGTVMASGLPYLAIQEYGGVTSPHDIFPVNASVLAFMSPGSAVFKEGSTSGDMVFTRVVHHPGSVMPERSYMRYALAQRRSSIRDSLFAATQTAVAGQA